MRRRLTDRQRLVLDVIRRWIAQHGYPPTLRELGGELGIASTNGVNDHLVALERKGWIVRTDRLSRGIRLADQPTRAQIAARLRGFADELRAPGTLRVDVTPLNYDDF